MEQRTCNLILCCKGWCKLDPDGKPLTPEQSIAKYMSKECACPEEDYKGRLLETILKTAVIDFFRHSDNPGYHLWQLLENTGLKEMTLTEHIITLFSLVDVKRQDTDGKYHYVNGFTKELIAAGEKYLSEKTE